MGLDNLPIALHKATRQDLVFVMSVFCILWKETYGYIQYIYILSWANININVNIKMIYIE